MKKKTDGMLALFFSFFFFLWFLILCREPKGDTVRFLQFLGQTPALELLRERLASETTRVILEAILFFFLQRHWLLFALANAAVTALAIRLLGRLSDRLGRACALPASEERAPLLLMTFLFFLYPLEDLAAAGIPPTFINYVWPSAFGLLALWPVTDLLAGKRERIPAPWLAASPVLILIAGNMEQMAAILTGALTGAAGYYAAKNYAVRQLAPGNGSAGGAENGADRKARRDSLAALLFLDMLAALSLLFHLQGGNAARMELSIRTYWPGFERLTVLEKLGNGVFATMNHLLSIPNLIVLSAAFLLFLLAATGRGKSRLLRAAGTLPFLWELLVLALKAGEVLTEKQLLFWLNGVDDPYTDAALCPAGRTAARAASSSATGRRILPGWPPFSWGGTLPRRWSSPISANIEGIPLYIRPAVGYNRMQFSLQRAPRYQSPWRTTSSFPSRESSPSRPRRTTPLSWSPRAAWSPTATRAIP